MEYNELDKYKSIWMDDSLQDDLKIGHVSEWNKKLNKLRWQIMLRNIVEISAAVVSIIIYGFFLIHVPSLTSKLGSVIVILSLLFIIITFIRNRVRVDDVSVTVVEAGGVYKIEMEKQILMLQSLIFWYITPLATGIIIFTLGLELPWYVNILSVTVILIVNVVVYLINRRALKKKLLPEYYEICSMLKSLEGEADI